MREIFQKISLSLKSKLYPCNTEREMKATFVWIVFLSFDILKQ